MVRCTVHLHWSKKSNLFQFGTNQEVYSSQMTTKVQTKSFIKSMKRLLQHIFHFVNVHCTGHHLRGFVQDVLAFALERDGKSDATMPAIKSAM